MNGDSPLVDRFIQARNYTPTSGRDVDLGVVHTMEAPEKTTTAENVANWFAGSTAPKASTTYNIDSDSIVQSVREKDVAWCAPGANHDGIHLEHAGYAAQGRSDWQDPYSQAMLKLSAKLMADICRRHAIPVVKLSSAQVRAGHRGLCGHIDVTRAFPERGGTHTDPGSSFPWEQYLQLIKAELAPEPEKPWPTPLPAWFWKWAAWRLGEGEYKAYGAANPLARPKAAPETIPAWAWRRLSAFLNQRR